MTDAYPTRIWLNPPKFWMATKGMSQEEVDRWMDHIWDLAERSDLESLKQFDFIMLGNPYNRNAA